jgi:tripartite-type tricarboxylate transporter receptor subunit TctC
MSTPWVGSTRSRLGSFLVLLLTGMLWVCGPAHAAEPAWPAKPIRLVVSYPPGGTTDIYGRLLAQSLQKVLGQSVVVDNRAGAGGAIGLNDVAKAAPDGYTLGLGLGAMAIMPSLYKSLPFDVVRDFSPVSLIMTTQNVVIVPASSPMHSMKDLLAFAKANPGKLNYASSGLGATPHLSMELLKTRAGVAIEHIPYKGDTPAMTDLLAGRVQMYSTTIGGVLQHIRAGRVRALAVTGKTRASVLPEVPTMEEAGLPDYEIVSWYGVIAPAQTPPAIIERLNAAVVEVMSDPAVNEQVIASGAKPATSTPGQFAGLIKNDVVRFNQIAKAAGVQPE